MKILFCFSTLLIFLLSGCVTNSQTDDKDEDTGEDNPSPVVLDLGYISDHSTAKESVLRSIPESYINKARNNLKIFYAHTSHGTHVSYGMYGLQDYKTGDNTLFGISTIQTDNKLYFEDHSFSFSPTDLSTADSNWAGWITNIENYLDNDENDEINVMIWSWCNIRSHNVDNYLSSMKTLIDEYGKNGTKIGTGTGKTKTVPVDFIFMTGHANKNANIGDGNPKNLADKILDYCKTNGYFCLDYYNIDTHDMYGTYWEDTGDDGDSDSYTTKSGSSTGNFYLDWQNLHQQGTAWYVNKNAPGGTGSFGAHNSQHITANRKAYALWWILARLSGWNG